MLRVPGVNDGGGPLPRRAVQVAVAIALAAYAYVRLYVLADLLPGPYDPEPITLLVRIADFLAGGTLFFMVADAITGTPAKLFGIESMKKMAKEEIEVAKRTGTIAPGGAAIPLGLYLARKIREEGQSGGDS